MATDPRVLALLTSIDAGIQRLCAALPPAPTNDRVCDGPHGDPIVKQKDPRDWSGESMKDRHFSECPPAYLDLLAERFDYFASKEEDAKKQKYNLLDASRARAWAARLRKGWKPVETSEPQEGEPRW